MKASNLTEMTPDELTQLLAEEKEELFNLRFRLATNQLDNTARIGAAKKNIARILTVMRQQEIEAWRAQQAAARRNA